MTQQNKIAVTNNQMATNMAQKQTSRLKQYAPLLIIVGLMAFAFSQGWHKYLTLKELALNLETLQTFLAQNYLSAILAYIGIYIVVTALSIPGGAAITIAGGLLFGWFVGTLSTVVGATIGATLIFLAAKTSLGELLKAKAGPWLKQLEQGFEENATSYMFFLRLVPAFPFWLVNLAPAFLGVKLSTFMFTTFFGIIPGTLAFSYIGQGLESVISAQKQSYENCVAAKGADGGCVFGLDASSLITPHLIIALVLISLVALIPVIIKRLKTRNQKL